LRLMGPAAMAEAEAPGVLPRTLAPRPLLLEAILAGAVVVTLVEAVAAAGRLRVLHYTTDYTTRQR
jgi:hypothetical protein